MLEGIRDEVFTLRRLKPNICGDFYWNIIQILAQRLTQSLPLLSAPIDVEGLLVPSVEIGFDDFVVFTAGFLSKFSDFSEGCRSL